jgi:hypothetical protein
MPRAVVWGPRALGGLELNTNIYNVQAQCAVSYLVRAIRWQGSVASDIIATLNALQLLSGFTTPVLVSRDWEMSLQKLMVSSILGSGLDELTKFMSIESALTTI